MDKVKPVKEKGRVGAEITTRDGKIRVAFAVSGDPSGHIVITSGSKTLADRDLATSVQPQKGLAGK
jgi:hypothetical protein